MAKLKDIFPKWILREKSYGELELGGGGSAFAHLSEGDGTGPFLTRGVRSDAEIATFSDIENPFVNSGVYGAGAYMGHYMHEGPVDPAGVVYELWSDAGNGNGPIFSWNEDGSLHWGDGVAGPDVSLGRDDGSGFWGSGLVVSDSLFVNGNGASLGINSVDQSRSAELRPNVLKLTGPGGNQLLQVDADGDFAVQGKGKIAFQP